MLICFMTAFMTTGCGGNDDDNDDNGQAEEASFYDGQYHAEYDRYDVRNWRPYIDITVKDGKITKAYYDYTNEAGDKRSENESYIEGLQRSEQRYDPERCV